MELAALNAATDQYKEQRAQQPLELEPERSKFVRMAMRNINPILDLNVYDVREAMRMLHQGEENPQPIALFQNKDKTKGFYLDENGVYVYANPGVETRRVEAGEKYYAFMNELIMDDFVFVHPQWLGAEDITKRLQTVPNEIIEALNRKTPGAGDNLNLDVVEDNNA